MSFSNFGLEENDRPAQSPDLNPSNTLLDEVECHQQARPYLPASVSIPSIALLAQWEKIPVETSQKLAESLKPEQ